ncbi:MULTISPECIES: hypothetical protein [Burkholderia]|nr:MULTISPECIES: hypothetical protein [Burkholderia]
MIEADSVKIGAALFIGPSGGSQRATLLTSPERSGAADRKSKPFEKRPFR